MPCRPIELRLDDAREAAIDRMIDEYLLQQASAKQKLSIADYFTRVSADHHLKTVASLAGQRADT
jgi:hypothetical protein